MANARKDIRYQVLYRAHPPKTGVEYVNCRTLRQAEIAMARLQIKGEQEVRIWDVLDNPISDLLRLG